MLKILIADPDEAWSKGAKEYFTKNLYHVDSVDNGKKVQINISADKYFALIISEQISNFPLVSVLKYLKNNAPGVRVIITTTADLQLSVASPERLEMLKQIVRMGFQEPIKRSDDYKVLKNLMDSGQNINAIISKGPIREGVSDEEEVAKNDDQFCDVRIEEFFSGKSVLFDVYVKISTNKYVKILHEGDSFSNERIKKYKDEKGVQYLYFSVEDRKKYIMYSNYMTEKLISNEKISTKTKVSMLKNTTEKFVEDAFSEGMKPQIIEQGKHICTNVYKLIENEKNLYQLLRDYQDFDPDAYSHAYLVTLFAGSILKQFEWQSQSTLETTSLACMFHDIGKSKLPPQMLHRGDLDLSAEEVTLYQTHPQVGAQMLEGNRMVTISVKQIILQHHECYDGSGYPQGLKGSKILTLSNIVKLADDFVHVVVDRKLRPVDALRHLLRQKESTAKYNSAIVENFIKVFADPEKIKKENKNLQLSNINNIANRKVS